jgi:hypothetical protein
MYARSFSADDYKIGGTDPGCLERLFDAYGPPLVKSSKTGLLKQLVMQERSRVLQAFVMSS